MSSRQILVCAVLLMACTTATEPMNPQIDPPRNVTVTGKIEFSAGLTSYFPGLETVVVTMYNPRSAPAAVSYNRCSFVLLGYASTSRTGPPDFRRDGPGGDDCALDADTTIVVGPGGVQSLIAIQFTPNEYPSQQPTQFWLRLRVAGESRAREYWITQPVFVN